MSSICCPPLQPSRIFQPRLRRSTGVHCFNCIGLDVLHPLLQSVTDNACHNNTLIKVSRHTFSEEGCADDANASSKVVSDSRFGSLSGLVQIRQGQLDPIETHSGAAIS